MRNFIQYLKIKEADVQEGKPLDHTASAQYGGIRLAKDDVLWIVSIRNYHLQLLGRLVVDVVVNQREAERLQQEALWEAPFHAIAKNNSIHKAHVQDIQDLAAILRFNSPKDRLKLEEPDRVDGKQIQSIRELTPDSVELLQKRLDSVL